jgi:hypothetical protein
MLISTLLPLKMGGAQALHNGLAARGISGTRWRRQTEMRMRVASYVPALLELQFGEAGELETAGSDYPLDRRYHGMHVIQSLSAINTK